MLLIKTYLKEVENKGIGLFTAIDLPMDYPIHVVEPRFNKVFTKDEIGEFGPIQLEFYNTYMVHLPDGSAMLDLDNTRFINHSYTPNLICDLEVIKTCRVIKAGEELTLNYISFDSEYRETLDFEVYE